MLVKSFNHFRLIWRLTRDKRVNVLLKMFLLIVPTVYLLMPFPFVPIPDDLIPVVGLLDDFFFLIVTSIIFKALCPRDVVDEHRRQLTGHASSSVIGNLEAYRNPSETRDLAIGFLSSVGLTLLGGYLAGVLLMVLFGIGYLRTTMERGKLLSNAVQVSQNQLPTLYHSLTKAQAHLPPVDVNLFVSQNPMMNAYTFGHSEPYTIVLTSALVEKLNSDEIQAVSGHEFGHILFGHTAILSLLGTQQGLGRLLFNKWSRSCEYSADSIAFLATGKDTDPVAASLLKITSGLQIALDVNRFVSQLDEEEAGLASISEIFSTHPFLRNRIQHVLQLARREGAPTASATV